MKWVSLFLAAMLVFSAMFIFPAMPAKHNDTYDFLIIAHEKFVKELQKFVEYKNEHGIKTKLVGLNEIYEGRYFKCHGRDDAEKIKYFIKDAYDAWHIKYVMLVGSADLLPVRYSYLNDISSTWEYERKFISDLYYADIYDANGSFSSWDSNNNGYYGEFQHEINGEKYTDKVDLYPEVAISRLACRNNMELKNAINKIMAYEAGMKNNKILLAGGDSYPNDPCGNIPEGIYLENKIAEVLSNYEAIKLYPPENAAEISRHINEGVAIAVLEGAGAHHLWATHAYDSEKWIYYYGWNIRLLKNDIYPIVVTSGARLAKFDEKRECFNWIWVASRHGGVASLGSTGLCWTGHGRNVSEFYLGNLHLRFFQQYKNCSRLGDAWKNAIVSYLNAFEWNGKVEKAFHMKAAEEFIIFGDPTLSIHSIESMEYTNVLYVGGSGPNNYTSIQAAVNAANNGDTIIVLPGVYNENVSIDKKIEIMGRNATLVGSFNIFSSAKIRGFEIKGENYSIKCKGNDAFIEGNSIHSYYGIVIENASCVRINENDFECRYGVYMKNSPYAKFNDNTFHNNWYGIWAEKCDFMEITNNNFSSNRWYTLWLEGSNGSIVENNSFYKNWYSIFLYHSNDCIIEKNEILHNEHGPQIVFSSHNSIRSNDIRYNEHYGLYVDNASKQNEITKNNIIDNAYNARDDGKNKWHANYWSDYIGNKYRLLAFLRVPKFIPKFNFDWHPALQPYEL